MAINKRKVLETARKHAQKGAKQKALKEYNKLIQADPRDAKLLLEVGDSYRRWGQADEAIAQYTKVANQYKQDGFDARAVAVLKQILNLDPKSYTAHVALADLYQRMGLESEAIGALQTAADGYYREGRRREALELLRKTASLDPANTTSRLKVADLLRQEGMEEDAVLEYEEVCAELGRNGGVEQVTVVQQRILEIQPNRIETLVSLAQNLCDIGHPGRAEPFAARAVAERPEPEHFELQISIYKSLNDETRMAEVTRELAAMFRDRGDDDRAREVMQRLPADAVLQDSGPGADLSEAEDEDPPEDELLEDEDFLLTGADDLDAPLDADPESASAGGATADAPLDDALPEGDPEQLFAEASVYLRYGKRDQAVASLRSVIAQAPDHRGAHEKLGEAFAENGQNEEAVSAWQAAAELAREEGDAPGYGILHDRIEALDSAAAAAMPTMDAAEVAADSSEADEELDLDESVDAELSFEEPELDAPADSDADSEVEINLGEAPDEAHAAQESEPDGEMDFEIDLDSDLSAEQEPDDDSFDVGADPVDDEFEIANEAEAVDGATPADAGPAVIEESASFGNSTGTAASIKGDLEEAEFYIQQELDDEAEAIYRRILEVAPNHPSALLKLGEIAARRGEDPAIVSPEPAVAASSSEVGEDDGLDFEFDVDDEATDVEEVEGEAGEFDIAIDSADDDEDDLDALMAAAEAAVDSRREAAAEESETEAVADGEFEIEIGLEDDEAGAEDEIEMDVAAAMSEATSADADADVDVDVEPEFEIDVGLEEEETEDDIPAVAADESWVGEDATEVATLGPELDDEEEATAELEFTSELVQAEPETLPHFVGPSDDETATEAPSRSMADETMPLGVATGESNEEPVAAASGDEDATFDLGEALADVFDDDAPAQDDDPNASTSSVQSTVDDGFASVFADFKKGVSATLEEGDYDTRYDLGIAYREMGLFDDAIAEFGVCLSSDARRFDSLCMMGLCALEVGRENDAVSHFEQALATSDLPDERMVGVYFDLGRAHQASGDPERARSAYERVQEIEANFPGLADAIAALAAPDGGQSIALAANTADEYESFDDLMAGANEDEEADAAGASPAAETFESFDDLITDAEAEIEVMAEPEAPAEPAKAEPVEIEAAKPAKRGGRKKKISFV